MAQRLVLRPLAPSDARGASALAAESRTDEVWTESSLLHLVATTPRRARPRFFVAERAGVVLGFGCTMRDWQFDSRAATVFVAVEPAARRSGVGPALLDEALAHVGEADVEAARLWAPEGSYLVRLALRAGLRECGRELALRYAPQTEAPPVERPLQPGYEIRTLRDLDDPHALHSLYARLAADVPKEEPWSGFTLDEWRSAVWSHPDLSRDGSFVALREGEPVALAWLLVDETRKRAETELAGTLPEHRGRSLGYELKRRSLEWARTRGIRSVWTSNDVANSPILSLNAKLGFHIARATRRYEQTP